MKHASLSLLVVFSVFICLCGCHHADPAPAPQPEPVAEAPAEDPVGPIAVKGQAAENPRHEKGAQRKLAAQRGARVEAYRRLFEQLKGVHLDSQTLVEDFVTSFDQIETKSGGFLSTVGAMSRPVEEEEGLWAVTIELTAEEVRDMIEAINAERNR